MGSKLSTSNENDVCRSVNKFSNKLFSHLTDGSSNDANIVLSGLSVTTTMAMLLMGAKGETAIEIQECFNFTGNEETLKSGFKKLTEQLMNNNSPAVKLTMANRILVERRTNLLQSFAKKISGSFQGDVVRLQEDVSEAAKSVNDWIRQKTEGAIPEIVSAQDLDQVVIVLISALHLKADWATQFESHLTKTDKFYLTGYYDGPTVSTKMMNLYKKKFRSKKVNSIGATALEMPYRGDEMSAVFILPFKNDGFKKTEEKLGKVDLKDSFNFNEAAMEFKHVAIPKLKLRATFSLKEPLQALGIGKAFDSESADFAGMSETSDSLFVSLALQKVFVEMDEQGTTATAAVFTGLQSLGLSSSRVEPKVFICDRPFFFFIRDNKTGVVLFIGRIVRPVSSKL